MTGDVEAAMHAARGGHAEDWPTVAAVLAAEVERLRDELGGLRLDVDHLKGEIAYLNAP